MDQIKMEVLEERLKHFQKAMDDMQTNNKDMSQDIKKIASSLEKIDITIEKLENQSHKVDDVTKTVNKHETIGKVLIFILTMCGGLIGWGYSTLEQLKAKDDILKDRIVKLEYELHAVTEDKQDR